MRTPRIRKNHKEPHPCYIQGQAEIVPKHAGAMFSASVDVFKAFEFDGKPKQPDLSAA